MPTDKQQKIDGWISVTEVLDSFIPKGLLDWYLKTGKKEAKRLSTVALKIGSRVDELISQDVRSGSYKISSKDPIEVKNCLEAWESFKTDFNPSFKGCQIEVKDDESKIIGHIDLVQDRIIDVKCASSIKDNYWIQVSKYHQMFGRDVFYPPAILRLDKNLATYQYLTAEQAKVDVNQCIRVFDGLLEVYRFYNPPSAVEEVVNE